MAAPVIISRTISAATDKAIVLSNGQAIRPIPFGSSWTQIRIGVRWHCRDTGANLTSNPQLTLGVCAGNSNVWGDSSATHCMGANANAATWTRTSANRYLVSGSTTWFPAKKVGTTITRGTGLQSSWQMGLGAASSTADRELFFVHITKASPYTVRIFHYITNNTPVDQSETIFLQQMELTTPSLTDHAWPVSQNLTVDEGTDGTFDHLFIHWDRTTPEIEICDLAVARFA